MAELKLDLKINPVVTISMGKDELAIIKFDGIDKMGKFLSRLRKAIEEIIIDMEKK